MIYFDILILQYFLNCFGGFKNYLTCRVDFEVYSQLLNRHALSEETSVCFTEWNPRPSGLNQPRYCLPLVTDIRELNIFLRRMYSTQRIWGLEMKAKWSRSTVPLHCGKCMLQLTSGRHRSAIYAAVKFRSRGWPGAWFVRGGISCLIRVSCCSSETAWFIRP